MKKLKMVIYFILLIHILSYCESRSLEFNENAYPVADKHFNEKSPHGLYTPDTLCRKADNVYTIRQL